MKYKDFLKDSTACPFCDITKDRILEENGNAYLTYAVAPYHSDHVLVCPKRHAEHLLELTQEEIKDIDALQESGLAILEKLGYEDITILVREGKKSGKSVSHSHYHIIPAVVLEAGIHSEGERAILTAEEQNAVIARIKSVIM